MLLVDVGVLMQKHSAIHYGTQSLVSQVKRCIHFRNIREMLLHKDIDVPPHFRPLCDTKHEHFSDPLPHSPVHRVVQTGKLQVKMVPPRTKSYSFFFRRGALILSNTELCLDKCWPANSCQKLLKLDVPETGHDSCVLLGGIAECKGCTF